MICVRLSKISSHCDDWYLFKVRLSRKVAAFDIAYTVFACRVACDRGISWCKIQIRGLRYATWSILDFDEFCFPKMVILMSHKLCCLCAYRVIVGYQSGQTLAARHLQQLPCTTTSKQVMASLMYEQGLRGYWMFSTTGWWMGLLWTGQSCPGPFMWHSCLCRWLEWTVKLGMDTECWDIRVAHPGYIDICSKLNWSTNGDKDSEIECWLAIYPST